MLISPPLASPPLASPPLPSPRLRKHYYYLFMLLCYRIWYLSSITCTVPASCSDAQRFYGLVSGCSSGSFYEALEELVDVCSCHRLLCMPISSKHTCSGCWRLENIPIGCRSIQCHVHTLLLVRDTASVKKLVYYWRLILEEMKLFSTPPGYPSIVCCLGNSLF